MSDKVNIESSEAHITHTLNNRTRLRLFYNVYKKAILFVTIPLILLPVAFIGENNAYVCFYTFLITAAYWIFEVLHPAVISLIPIFMSTIMYYLGYEIISFINIRHALIDCLGILIFILAMEESKIHKRISLKLLLIFGYSHYRLCFLLFFTTMTLSMWLSNSLACGFMVPIIKATIIELENMGILEIYETTGKGVQDEQRDKNKRSSKPTDFTIFYSLGIAYSSSIGGLATMVGSQTNQIFKAYSERLFPLGPKIEFPQFMLLTLPAVLLLETAFYLWMNFYFLGLFRIHNYSALQTGSTEEEAQYVKTLLNVQYQRLGKLTTKELIIGTTLLLIALLQITSSTNLCDHYNNNFFISHMPVSAPTILGAVILFTVPTDLKFLKFFKKRTELNMDTLPSSSSKPCLHWKTVKDELHWGVLLVTGGSCAMFEGLKQSQMTDEFEKFLRLFAGWPAVLQVLVVVVFCKILTEFASNTSVAHCMLDHVARVSLVSKVNPHYLMLAMVLSCSAPFHLITGTPANAIVSSHFHIPHQRMIYAGVGPSIFSIFVIWFTVAVWSKVIWTDISLFPDWANYNTNLTLSI